MLWQQRERMPILGRCKYNVSLNGRHGALFWPIGSHLEFCIRKREEKRWWYSKIISKENLYEGFPYPKFSENQWLAAIRLTNNKITFSWRIPGNYIHMTFQFYWREWCYLQDEPQRIDLHKRCTEIYGTIPWYSLWNASTNSHQR